MSTITALAVATTQQSLNSLAVFLASAERYLPQEVRLYIYSRYAPYNVARNIGNCIISTNEYTTFGAVYNAAAEQMLNDGNEHFAICNDDIVLDPNTWGQLQEDYTYLHSEGVKVGILASRSNYVRIGPQNIIDDARKTTNIIVGFPVISPILAVYNRSSWVDFLPINWESDDVQSYDILSKGYGIYISRAYVHHVGSQTMTQDTWEAEKHISQAYIAKHRPDLRHMIKTLPNEQTTL